MSTTCNTPATHRIQLPSLDDPSLNEPTITARAEFDIMAGLEDTQCVRELRTPRAKALLIAGLESKAWRAEICGSKRIQRCPTHPDQFEEQHRTCRLKTCAPCAPRLAEERIARFWDNQPYMRNLKQFQWVIIHRPTQQTFPTRDEIQDFNTAVSKWIKKFGDPRPGTGAISHLVIENIGGPACENGTLDQYHFRLNMLILWWGELPAEAIAHDIAPGCVKYSVEKAADIRSAVRELLTIYPHKSHEICVQLEVETKDLRLIRTHGQMLKKDLLLDEDTFQLPADSSTEALVAEEGDTATNAIVTTTTTKKCCKKCGGAFSEVSDWIDRYATPAEIKQVRWTIVNNSPPPW